MRRTKRCFYPVTVNLVLIFLRNAFINSSCNRPTSFILRYNIFLFSIFYLQVGFVRDKLRKRTTNGTPIGGIFFKNFISIVPAELQSLNARYIMHIYCIVATRVSRNLQRYIRRRLLSYINYITDDLLVQFG